MEDAGKTNCRQSTSQSPKTIHRNVCWVGSLCGEMEVEDISLYKTLGVDPSQVDVLTLSERDITRAYRKVALKWHPDKNRSDPDAANKFSAIFVAYETLLSPTERAKYDAAIRAVRSRRERFERLDAGRKQLKSDLQRREAAAEAAAKRNVNLDTATLKRMQREIDRLRQDALREDAQVKREPVRKSKPKSEAERSAGEWTNVKGYDEFRAAAKTELDFEAFEQAVLSGRFP